MKRLLYYLRNMDNNTTTWREMYEGPLVIQYPPKYDPLRDEYIPYPPEEGCSNVYYSEQYSFRLEYTHKLAQDKPTLVLQIPCRKLGISNYTVPAADYCLRRFIPYLDALNQELENRSRPDTENGKYEILIPSGAVIKNNAVFFAECPQRAYEYGGKNIICMSEEDYLLPEMCLCFRLQVQLPHKKIRRTIQMLSRDLPDAVEKYADEFSITELQKHMSLAEKQTEIRRWLKDSPYCAFIANGSILPRQNGGDLPMTDAVPFQSPPEDEITVCGIQGMGIRKGVTVITGGGYSGKSTLLDTIAAGIHDHTWGDGRELCITDASAITISAEDGRSVRHVNLSPFIRWIPGKDPLDFSTDHASGATSQAANIMEAVECDGKLLLIDEDRSAANFMIQDRLMKTMIRKEPITPFTERVQELYRVKGVSAILVIGGSGAFLSVADNVYIMDDFRIINASEQVQCILQQYPDNCPEQPAADWEQTRMLTSDHFTSYPEGSGSETLTVSDAGVIRIGDEKISTDGLHDLTVWEQLNTIGFIIRFLMVSNRDKNINLPERLNALYERLESEDMDFLYSSYFTECGRYLVLPRRQEVLAVIHRMQKIRYRKGRAAD